jgi:hypothetical protein
VSSDAAASALTSRRQLQNMDLPIPTNTEPTPCFLRNSTSSYCGTMTQPDAEAMCSAVPGAHLCTMAELQRFIFDDDNSECDEAPAAAQAFWSRSIHRQSAVHKQSAVRLPPLRDCL